MSWWRETPGKEFYVAVAPGLSERRLSKLEADLERALSRPDGSFITNVYVSVQALVPSRGEVFVVCAPTVSAEEAKALTRRLRLAIASGKRLFVTNKGMTVSVMRR